jgi:hypothetical protein
MAASGGNRPLEHARDGVQLQRLKDYDKSLPPGRTTHLNPTWLVDVSMGWA